MSKMLRVALVVPPSTRRFNDACPPLNLGYIASYLRKTVPNIKVQIIDGMAKQDVWKLLFEFHPDVIGVTATTPQAPSAYRLLDSIKQNHPEVYTVLGGIHASVLPQEATAHADTVIIGEGEQAFADLICDYIEGKPHPKIVNAVPIENLDTIPSPAFDLIDLAEYLKHGPPFPGLTHPIVSMVTSRGCPFRCPFCWNSARTSKVRYFSAQRIVDELLFFHREYGVCSVFFNDDEFLINRKRLSELAELFNQHGITKWIKWGCQARAKTCTEETLQLAKSMGCVVVSPGFESGCQETLNYLKCGTTTLADNEAALNAASKVGVLIGGSFIFGNPNETLEQMQESFQWFENHDQLKFIGVNTIIPYPGTEVWKLCQNRKLLPEKVDYEQLVPTSVPSETYIVSQVPYPKYVQFVTDVQRVSWILTQVRLDPSWRSFFRLAQYKTWWYVWLKHPSKMLNLCAKLWAGMFS